MSSRFVKYEETKRKTWKNSGNNPIYAWFQFVPARVTDVVTNPKHSLWLDHRDQNAIMAVVHVEDAFGSSRSFRLNKMGQKYYPLMRGMNDVPLKGEQVLTCTFGGINYYLGPINTENNVNFNPDKMALDHTALPDGVPGGKKIDTHPENLQTFFKSVPFSSEGAV